MSVEQAVRCYGTFAGTVFSDVKQPGGDGSFKASKLEMAIKEIVKSQTGKENELMIGMPPHAKGCKT